MKKRRWRKSAGRSPHALKSEAGGVGTECQPIDLESGIAGNGSEFLFIQANDLGDNENAITPPGFGHGAIEARNQRNGIEDPELGLLRRGTADRKDAIELTAAGEGERDLVAIAVLELQRGAGEDLEDLHGI